MSTQRIPTLFAFFAALWLVGCTSISIHHSDDAKPQIRWYYGVVSVTVAPGTTEATVVHSRGFGATRSLGGHTLGAWSEQAVVLSDASACRTVLWVPNTQMIVEIKRLLNDNNKSLSSLCFVTSGEKE